MPRTLYLHIGAHRTATTSIQMFLRKNIDALMAQGVFQPFGLGRHRQLMNDIFSGAQEIDEVAQTLDARADAKPNELHSIILSDEDVGMRRDLSKLARFREHFDVKVVYALRRQDTWLESWYLQNIKWQWQPDLSHCSFDAFLEQKDRFHWIEYDTYVRHLEDVFGAENLRLYAFEKEQMPDGPVAAFCKQVGIGSLSGFSKPQHNNSSRSPEMAEFMRHLPLDQARPEIRNVLVQACERVDRQVLGNTGKQSELLLPPERRRALLEDYAAGNRTLAQRHFRRNDLFLAPLPAADAQMAPLQLPETSEATMERLVAPLLAELIKSEAILSPKKAEELLGQSKS